MSTTKTDTAINYGGNTNDEVSVVPFNFGLNAGVTTMTKFEWIPNGGKDGAEQEALDIEFDIDGTAKSYRKFPVLKAFSSKGNIEITDPTAKEFKEAVAELGSVVTHILKCFVDTITIETAFAKNIVTFKEFCQIAMSLLPKDYATKKLDIFTQYQWTLKENQERTYLDLPSNMKHGKWLVPAVPGNWKENVIPDADTKVKKALFYTNAAGEEHPFVRNGWFMSSMFAKQQKSESAQTAAETAGEAAQNAVVQEDPTATNW